MEFETKLSSETIKQRLVDLTEPMNFSNSFSEHELISKWNKNDTFYLLKTGGAMSMKPVLPFVGRIIVRDGSAYIVGKFDLAKAAKIMLLCFFGLAWSMAVFGSFLNNNFILSGKITVFKAYAIWTILGYSIMRFLPGLFQKKQQADVIEFIKHYLLY